VADVATTDVADVMMTEADVAETIEVATEAETVEQQVQAEIKIKRNLIITVAAVAVEIVQVVQVEKDNSKFM
jgi:hypothetical protein